MKKGVKKFGNHEEVFIPVKVVLRSEGKNRARRKDDVFTEKRIEDRKKIRLNHERNVLAKERAKNEKRQEIARAHGIGQAHKGPRVDLQGNLK